MERRPFKKEALNKRTKLLSLVPNEWMNARQIMKIDKDKIYVSYNSYQNNLNKLSYEGHLEKQLPVYGNIVLYRKKVVPKK
jgi:hypothetical protein